MVAVRDAPPGAEEARRLFTGGGPLREPALAQTGGLDLAGMSSKMMIVISGKKIARTTQNNGLRPLLAASRNVK